MATGRSEEMSWPPPDVVGARDGTAQGEPGPRLPPPPDCCCCDRKSLQQGDTHDDEEEEAG